MELKLNVEGSQLDSEVKELLKNLTIDQKKSMAEDLLRKTFENTESSLNIKLAKQKALEITNSHFTTEYILENGEIKGSGWKSVHYKHEDFFNEKVKEYSELAGYFKDFMLKEILNEAKLQVGDMIKNSKDISDTIDKTKNELKEMMPKIIHDAMVLHFSTQMSNLLTNMSEQVFQTRNNSEQLQELTTRLSNHNIF